MAANPQQLEFASWKRYIESSAKIILLPFFFFLLKTWVIPRVVEEQNAEAAVRRCNFINVFFCEYCETFRSNLFFIDHL